MKSADQQLLAQLKKDIVSTVLPYKEGVTESELRRAYRSLLGKDVPFEEAGFRSLRDLLRALPSLKRDEVDGRWKAIPDESTRHLAALISAQRTKTKGNKKGKGGGVRRIGGGGIPPSFARYPSPSRFAQYPPPRFQRVRTRKV